MNSPPDDIHEVFYLMISVFIIYAEHYERLHVPLEKVRDYYASAETPETTQQTISHVAKKLQELMDQPEMWQNPELTGDEIVHSVGTNRTYSIGSQRVGLRKFVRHATSKTHRLYLPMPVDQPQRQCARPVLRRRLSVARYSMATFHENRRIYAN